MMVFFLIYIIDSYSTSDIVYEWIPGEVQFGNKELSQFQLKGFELTSKIEVFPGGEHNIHCFFISRPSSLSLFFWLSFSGLSPLFSKFVDMAINLSLKLYATQKQFPLSVFVFIGF